MMLRKRIGSEHPLHRVEDPSVNHGRRPVSIDHGESLRLPLRQIEVAGAHLFVEGEVFLLEAGLVDLLGAVPVPRAVERRGGFDVEQQA